MINFDEAIGLVLSVAEPLGGERIPLAEAAGRVLAAPITAVGGSPRAAVSGLAVTSTMRARPASSMCERSLTRRCP